MSNKNLTDITVVMDRSASMASCKDESEKGINKFVEEQRSLEGEANFTLVKFDNQYEKEYDGVNINTVSQIELVPRGSTALNDAIGKAINETGARLSSMSEKDRPGLVVFVILTDGFENCSREFTADQIKSMINKQQEVYSWEFTFLGANQDAILSASQFGIHADAALNYTPSKTDSVFFAASANVGRMRSDVTRGVEVSNSYTADEKSSTV
jgi:uncharacterized protein YegL